MVVTATLETEKLKEDLPHSVGYLGKVGGIRLHSVLCLLQAGQDTHPIVHDETNNLIAVQAASSLPPYIASLLPGDTHTIREDQASPD